MPLVLILSVVGAWGCGGGEKAAAPAGEAGAPPAASAAASLSNPLAGTEWRLVEFQSMDDAVGTVRPSDPSLYTMRLNGDGRDEVFVYLLGSIFCGTGGCTLQLFTESTGGYTLVSEFPVSRTPVIVSAANTGGWNDLYRLESGGGAAATYVKHVFDGTKYVERERMPADKAPDGTRCLAGDVSVETGIPLEPADAAAPGSGPSAPAPSETGFSTVCGVTVGGQDYRYKCTVEGAAAGTSGETVLHFPDNSVTLRWQGGGKATATFAGMVPKDITVTTADGVTRFPFEDKVYFFASDRAVAAAQLKTLR